MEKLPFVTICIPTYNRVSNLENIFNSIKEYDYPNLKIIISDDCSIDNTSILCSEFADKNENVTYYKQDINLGAFNNFNFLLSKVDTKYYILHSDDDYLDKNFISESVKFLELNSDYVIAGGVSSYEYELNGNKIKRNGKYFSIVSNNLFFRLIKYVFYNSDNYHIFGVKRTPKNIIYFPVLIPGEWVYMTNFLKNGKFHVIPNVKIYRSFGNNASMTLIGALKSIKNTPSNAIIKFIVLYYPWLYVSYNFARSVKPGNLFSFIFWFLFMQIKKSYELAGALYIYLNAK